MKRHFRGPGFLDGKRIITLSRAWNQDQIANGIFRNMNTPDSPTSCTISAWWTMKQIPICGENWNRQSASSTQIRHETCQKRNETFLFSSSPPILISSQVSEKQDKQCIHIEPYNHLSWYCPRHDQYHNIWTINCICDPSPSFGAFRGVDAWHKEKINEARFSLKLNVVTNTSYTSNWDHLVGRRSTLYWRLN